MTDFLTELAGFWSDWARPSAGLPIVLWSLLLAAAAVAGHVVQRYMGLPKVIGYSIVGTVVGFAGFEGAVWPLQGIGLFLLELGVAIVLFEAGGRLPLRWFRHNPMVLVQSIVEATLTYAGVFWLLHWMEVPDPVAAPIALVAMVASPAVLMRVVIDTRASGPVTERALTLATLNTFYGLALGFAQAGLIERAPSTLLEKLSPVMVVLGLSFVVGALMVLALRSALRVMSSTSENTSILLLAIIAAGAAITAQIGGASGGSQHDLRVGSIAADQPPGPIVRQERKPVLQRRGQRRHPVMREIATRQCDPGGPLAFGVRKVGPKLFQRAFREPAVGRDLAAEDVQHRRAVGIQLQHIVPRRSRRRLCPIVVKRANAGITPYHIRRGDRFGEVFRGEGAQIIAFLLGADRGLRDQGMFDIGGPDQGEIPLIRNGEYDAAVLALKEIATVMIVKLACHDMAAAHQPDLFGRVDPHHIAQDVFDPGPTGIDQRAGMVGRVALRACRADTPQVPLAGGRNHAGARHDAGPALNRVTGIQGDQPRILDPAIGIFVGLRENRLQRCPCRV